MTNSPRAGLALGMDGQGENPNSHPVETWISDHSFHTGEVTKLFISFFVQPEMNTLSLQTLI